MQRDTRLRSRAEFRRVLSEGTSVARPEFVVYYAPRVRTSYPRFGLVVSRRIGGAVSRNRIKRLLREALRPLADELRTPVDIVVVARQPIAGAGVAELRDTLTECARRAGLLER